MLFPVAAFAVHQLRYELAYGSHSSAALAAQGHGYLDSMAPWLGVLVALGFGSFLTRLARAAGGRTELRPRRSFAGLAALASARAARDLLGAGVARGRVRRRAPGRARRCLRPRRLLGGSAVGARRAARRRAPALRLGRRRGRGDARLAARRSSACLPRLVRPTAFSPVLCSPLARRSAGRAPPERCFS